jgi:hypothetical protein
MQKYRNNNKPAGFLKESARKKRVEVKDEENYGLGTRNAVFVLC